MLEGKPNIEMVYFTQGNQRKLIVALQFNGKSLHEVVNLFYGKDMMKSSWMRFKQIGNIFWLAFRDFPGNFHVPGDILRFLFFFISIKRLQYEFTTYTTLQDYYTIQLYNTTGNDTPRSKRL